MLLFFPCAKGPSLRWLSYTQTRRASLSSSIVPRNLGCFIIGIWGSQQQQQQQQQTTTTTTTTWKPWNFRWKSWKPWKSRWKSWKPWKFSVKISILKNHFFGCIRLYQWCCSYDLAAGPEAKYNMCQAHLLHHFFHPCRYQNVQRTGLELLFPPINHGSVENGYIWKEAIPLETHPFLTSMIMGLDGVSFSKVQRPCRKVSGKTPGKLTLNVHIKRD